MNRNNAIGSFERTANSVLNALVIPTLGSQASWILAPVFVTITYTGRRSGKTFSTPVMYFKRRDTVTIRVLSPDSKTWWRNFLDDGAPIALALPGGTRTGHATTHRTERGKVTVHVNLEPR